MGLLAWDCLHGTGPVPCNGQAWRLPRSQCMPRRSQPLLTHTHSGFLVVDTHPPFSRIAPIIAAREDAVLVGAASMPHTDTEYGYRVRIQSATMLRVLGVQLPSRLQRRPWSAKEHSCPPGERDLETSAPETRRPGGPRRRRQHLANRLPLRRGTRRGGAGTGGALTRTYSLTSTSQHHQGPVPPPHLSCAASPVHNITVSQQTRESIGSTLCIVWRLAVVAGIVRPTSPATKPFQRVLNPTRPPFRVAELNGGCLRPFYLVSRESPEKKGSAQVRLVP